MKRIARFRRDSSGSVTIEALFWVAIMGVLMTLISEATNAFHHYPAIQRSLQDTNRMMSIGLIRDPDVAEAYLHTLLDDRYDNLDVETVVDGDVVTTTITIPWTSLRLNGIIADAPGRPVVFRARHLLEWI
ncbi:hypothetical protein HKCCE3408_14435 [Rhodobacterales bacterium HKCCE3408]|nr:hypothetical protein [Rhodobacterales bacterium HKCCE3408]